MPTITHKLTLDLKRDFHQVLVMKEGDTDSRRVEITITDNGEKFSVGEHKVSLKWKKPDRRSVTIDSVEKLDDSTVGFLCTDQMLLVPGIAKADLFLYAKDGALLSTMPFQVSIKPTAVPDSELTSSSEFQSLSNLLKDFKEEHEEVKQEVNGYAQLAKSYAMGETDVREGEDTDNAKYYSHQAQSFAVGGTGSRDNEDTDNAKYYKTQAERANAAAAGSAANAKTSELNAKTSETNAKTSESNAKDSETDAASSAVWAESYAHGNTGERDGENTDNSLYYSNQAKTYADSWKGSLLPKGTIRFLSLPASGNIAGHMYNINQPFVTDDRFKDGAGYSYPAGTNVYWTSDGKWDCLSGALSMELTQAEYDALSYAEKMNGTIYYISDTDDGIPEGGDGVAGLVFVDSALSSTSTNPVQNRVITNALNQKASLASPSFTGIPKAPTAAANANSTQIATTAFVKTAVNALVNGAPETLDTLKEVADAIQEHQTVADSLTSAIGTKVDKVSGKGLSTNDYTAADKAKLDGIAAKATANAPSAAIPKANGAAAAGTETGYARGDHVHPVQTTISGNAGSASKWQTARTINGMSVDGTASRNNYGICSTAAGTAAKTVSCTGFSLVTGAEMTVRFIYSNTVSNPTLNVNSTGAKPIYYRGSAISASYLAANRTYTFRYNGTQWEFVGDINVDTDTNTWKANTASSEGYVASGSGHANKVWKTDANGNPAWREEEKPSATVAGVTGVKGNAESSYRTGNVNLTPGNIGAVSESYADSHYAPDYIKTQKTGIPADTSWFRIAEFHAASSGGYSTSAGISCTINIKRGYNSPAPEYHKVQLICGNGGAKFVNITNYGIIIIKKIRVVWNAAELKYYLDVYYDGTYSNNLRISIEDSQSEYNNFNYWSLITPVKVPETDSSVEILATNDTSKQFTLNSLARTDGGNVTGTWPNLTAGRAAKADALSNTSAVGSSTQPVYFNSSGKPTACSAMVNGIKGNAETSYRTGNVNLTPANIGLGNVPNVSTNDQVPTFTQAAARANIASGEKLSTIFGKLMKWFADLKTVAFTGSYADLTNKPSIPASVRIKGNAETSYRTGDVNLTPANIGALPLTGGAISGALTVSGLTTLEGNVRIKPSGKNYGSIINIGDGNFIQISEETDDVLTVKAKQININSTTKNAVYLNGNPAAAYKQLTQAQYNALTTAEQTNGTIYFITDSN